MTPEEQQKVNDVADMLLGKPRKWIEDFATQRGLDFDELIIAAHDFISHYEYLNKGELLDGVSVPDEFWEKFELVEKIEVPQDRRNNFFTCSC